MLMKFARGERLALVWLLTLAVAAAAAILPPLPQPQEYHRFADQRALLGVPNFLDTVTSFAFLAVAAWGLICVRQDGQSGARAAFAEPSERLIYLVFFGAIALTGFGSAYYHLAPDNARLVWDRLPLAMALASLLAAIIGERVSTKAGLRLLPALAALGAGSVLYWHWTELYAVGNLWPYVAVQFYAVAAIVLIAALFPSHYNRGTDLLVAAGFYMLAKMAELLDHKIFALGNIVSGHTLKHLLAAIAVYWVLRMLQHRRPR